MCGSLDGKGVWERTDTCICMAESFHSSPEIFTLFVNWHTPAQNKKFKSKDKPIDQWNWRFQKEKQIYMCMFNYQ